MGRPPSEEPDVHLSVPKLHLGELSIDVESLDAHLALRAQVANLVNLVAGVHASVDKVKIEIRDVDAEAELVVRLENTYNILDRTLTTLDENPAVVEKLLDTAEGAVQETGQIGREATGPGGAVGRLSSGVGDSLSSVTDSLSSVARKASPKRLVSGDGSGGSAGGSSGRKTAASAAAAGAAGLIGAALAGRGGKGRFRRRGGVRKLLP